MPNSAAESSRFREALQKPPFAFGRVIGDSFTGVGRTWFSVLRLGLALSLITAVLPFALAYALGMDPIEIVYDGEPTPIEFVFAALFILGSVVTLVFHAACLDITYRALIGHDTDLRGSLRRGLRYSAPLLVIAVLFTVGYTIGLIALVIPGVILAVG